MKAELEVDADDETAEVGEGVDDEREESKPKKEKKPKGRRARKGLPSKAQISEMRLAFGLFTVQYLQSSLRFKLASVALLPSPSC